MPPLTQADRAALAEVARRHSLGDEQAARLTTIADRLGADPHAPTSARERGRAVERHIADSLAGLELAEVRDARIAADLGAGAGLPGVALAVALPACEFREVESRQGKCAWIAALVAAAQIGNVRVICARAEQWDEGIGAHDLVVARALAAQAVVLEYAAPLLRVGGNLVEWRGRRDAEDEAQGDVAAEQLGLARIEVRRVQPFAGAAARHLHVFAKRGPTPAGFPRRPGLAARRPLAPGAAVPGRR